MEQYWGNFLSAELKRSGSSTIRAWPTFPISSTGPLLQAWYQKVYERSPYRLYALSNLGSFLSLLAFPALFEPRLTLKSQARLWSLAYFAFAVSCIYSAARGVAGADEKEISQEVLSAESSEGVRPGRGSYLLWVSLSACASILFLATTNQICQDIAPESKLFLATRVFPWNAN